MPITDKTRKALWARSGNRCAICRLELVQKPDGTEENLIIGEECHIRPSKPGGPRGSDNTGLDDYNNLLLLCANDHKRVDELTEVYTVETLLLIKAMHETWVKTTLERDVMAFTNDKHNMQALPKIHTGQQLVEALQGAHMLSLNNDEFASVEEAEFIGSFFEELQDAIDGLSDMSFGAAAQWGFSLNQQLTTLSSFGFALFGTKRSLRLNDRDKKDMGHWFVSSIIAVRVDNPGIIGEFLIVEFPTKFNIV